MDEIRRSLRNVCDLEKLNRQLVLKKIYPQSIYTLYQSLLTIDQLTTTVGKNAKIADYLLIDIIDQHTITIDSFRNSLRTCIHFIETTLNIETCRGLTSVLQFEENIIKKGISTTLDKVQQEYSENLGLFYKTQKFFNDLCVSRNTNTTKETDFVKIHETEKLGLSLQITHKRGEQLQTAIKQHGQSLVIADNFIIPAKDVRLKKSSATVDDIDFPQLVRLQDTIRKLKDHINDEIASAYLAFLSLLETRHYDDIDHFAKFVAKLDLLQCKAYVAKKFNYCRPDIVTRNENHSRPDIVTRNDDSNTDIVSFFSAKDLRHVLIEHIQTSEIYVTNDLELSRENGQGLLIYGTNAVGKTSFIRSIGICIILAQAGFYVPCSSFQYKPYTAIYSRILGNDNLFKGLSTFAVEMSELRVILKHADEQSLILGDELCSGTEMESALSIFASGLVALNQKRSTFLFATHFHNIVNYDEIHKLVAENTLKIKHMAVKYDREKDILLYERKLADGPGNRMYGLEVCKSLHLSADFLEKAFELRGKYFGCKSEFTHPVSKYNARKIRGICEICGEKMGEETHHLSQQKDANADGFIGSFHKNHPANLASVCEDCHRGLHHKINPLLGNNTIDREIL